MRTHVFFFVWGGGGMAVLEIHFFERNRPPEHSIMENGTGTHVDPLVGLPVEVVAGEEQLPHEQQLKAGGVRHLLQSLGQQAGPGQI